MRLEVFSPPYLFKGSRPTITTAPAKSTHGAMEQITSPDAANIRGACLIRNCVTTHSYDTNQRLVDLPISSKAGDIVKVTVPANPNIAPPGWYMLFIVSDNRVPSVAHWVQLT